MKETFAHRLEELEQRFLARATLDADVLRSFVSDREGCVQGVTGRVEIQRIAHRLAGAAGTFGLHQIGICATEVEALVSEQPDSPDLSRACDALVQAIRVRSKRVGSPHD